MITEEELRAKGIPLPSNKRVIKYPFADTKHGEYFDCKEPFSEKLRNSVIASAYNRGYKVVTRKIEGNKLRVWRV